MRLSILLLCFLHGTCWTSANHCLYQPKTLFVKEGDSVAIPCTYTYPEDLSEGSQIDIYWGEGDGRDCSNIRKDITDRSGNIMDEYKDRISTVHHPDHRMASLLIREPKASDGVTYCCTPSSSSLPYSLYISDGTSLTFEGGEWLSQVEELMVVPGEELIIPCHYPMETMGEALKVTWYIGDVSECEYNGKKVYTWRSTQTIGTSPYSLVNFPKDVSLRIHSLQRDELPYFCCRVTTRSTTIESEYGTELIIADATSKSQFVVTQPVDVTVRSEESTTIRCSYSQFKKNDVLKVNIYWRVGSITGPYVYHPYKEMVHPDYRGRTGIKRASDLHIRGVQMSDNATYYCFVMLKLCESHAEYKNFIRYGKGTRLIVTDPTEGGQTESPLDPATIIWASYIACKFFIALGLFALGLFCYKNT